MATPRTQSSIAVSADELRWVLLNASPDLRQQIAQTPCLHPRDGPRNSPIVSVILTNADVDHVAGLLTLRESQPFALYATRRILNVLSSNPVFNVLDSDVVRRHALAFDEDVEIAAADGRPSGLAIRLFAVPGKVALYLEDPNTGPNFGSVAEDTAGIEVRSLLDDSRFYYVPGCSRVSDDLAKRLDGTDLVLFDGTVWTDDEMAMAGVGSKSGQRMGHISMSGPNGSIAAFEGRSIGRKVFVHINNTNPVLIADSAERRTAEAAGWEIAFDGMEVEL